MSGTDIKPYEFPMQCPVPTKLLIQNEIEEKGATAIARGLRKCGALSELDMAGNSIRELSY